MTVVERKICQQCKSEFAIEDADRAFYEKIAVPSPTWCPQCRLIRRMAFSNERMLYTRTCDLCKEQSISIYDADAPFPVYCISCWRSDKWNPLDYGVAYDFSVPFFEQFRALRNRVPRMALIQQGSKDENEGSQYTNRASYNKNCYLLFRANFNENVSYGYSIWTCKDSMDCFGLHESELCYGCIDCYRCFGVRLSQECSDCRDSQFLYGCRNCSDCFGCVNLRNKQYHIWNEPYSKEEYEKKMRAMGLEHHPNLVAMRDRFEQFKLKFIREYMVAVRAEEASGNWIYDSKNVQQSFMCRKVEDGKYLFSVSESRDCQDHFYWGKNCELVYETANCGYDSSNVKFCNLVYTNCNNIEYSSHCISLKDSFGCIGVSSGQYCVLNRKYPKAEFEALRKKIIEHMDTMPFTDALGRVYRYGEFFPSELSEFAWNETAAQDYFPRTKEEVEAQGYAWKVPGSRVQKVTMPAADLPTSVAGASADITKEVIGCEHGGTCNENCTIAFRITPAELSFYEKLNLPVPRLCFNCRHAVRLARRNPPQLWERQCVCDYEVYKNSVAHAHHATGRCPNRFETSYAPDRKEIVYCSECYRAEVV